MSTILIDPCMEHQSFPCTFRRRVTGCVTDPIVIVIGEVVFHLSKFNIQY